MRDAELPSAYGGPGWSPRTQSLSQEMGRLWSYCGIATEWDRLEAVLLHRPGIELEMPVDPDRVQMLATVEPVLAREQHDSIAQAYEDQGIAVHYVNPAELPPPNLMYVADLMFMTPEGAVVGRPASSVRAGEERPVARRLGELGVPILRTVRGTGTFEGADAAWVDPHTVLLATGPRTNAEGAAQVSSLLEEMGVDVIQVGLPYGVMHLMGQLRLADCDLAFAWPTRVPHAAVELLRAKGVDVMMIPDEREAVSGMALNFVTLGPRRILMASENPVTQRFYESAGVECITVAIDELVKAAGGIGCLTGILARETS